MAQFPNNDFGHDTNAEHTIRCEFFVSGAAVHGVELAFRGTLEAKITAHLATWKALEFQHEDEKGDALAATGLINTLKDELEGLIVQGRYFVNSLLGEVEVEGVDEHDIRRDFGIKGKIPGGVEAMIDLGRQMAAINAKYIVELSPYALPAAPFEEIGTVAEDLSSALDARKVEHREQMHVGKLKEIERKLGDRLLSRAFNWAVAVWGYDEPRLEDLGFVPKSQIHTPGDPEPGEENPFPNPLTGLNAVINELGHPSVKADMQSGAVAYNFFVVETLIGEPIGERPFEAEWKVISEPSIMDTQHTPGTVKTYWACGVDEFGVEGEFCDPVSVEIM